MQETATPGRRGPLDSRGSFRYFALGSGPNCRPRPRPRPVDQRIRQHAGHADVNPLTAVIGECTVAHIRLGDFAHNFARNKQNEAENIKDRVIRLYDFEEGATTTKLFKMEDIMDIINDPWIVEQLQALEELSKRIRER